MISASAGNGGSVVAPGAASFDDSIFACASALASTTGGLRFLQADHEAAVGDRAAHVAIATGRQPQPPVKAALRQFEPVNDRGAQRRRIAARAGNDEVAV